MTRSPNIANPLLPRITMTRSSVLQQLTQRQAQQTQTWDLPQQQSFQNHYQHNWLKSDFLLTCQQRYPDAIKALFADGWMDCSMGSADYKTLLQSACEPISKTDALYPVLRAFRQQQMYRIAWRNLAGTDDIWQSMREISALADVIIHVTLCTLQRLHDVTEPEFMIIAMGKLGAHELNFSSDIDLIFAYEGERIHEARLLSMARDFIDVLNRITDQGFVYRVDMRLRPFGSTGPLVMHRDALVDYYHQQGRDWERYAMIKARVLTGSDPARMRLQQALQDFAFRPYVDYGMQQAIRSMKALIDKEVLRKNSKGDIKLGKGGIREIEFIVQAKQLTHAGQYTQLHCAGIDEATERLVACEVLTADQAKTLLQDYAFLRQVEHYLQMLRDAQTHMLPTNELDQNRLAVAMGLPNWPAAQQVIHATLNRVAQAFCTLLNAEAGQLSPAPATRATMRRRPLFSPRQRWQKTTKVTAASPATTDFWSQLGNKKLTDIAKTRLQHCLPLIEQAAQQCAQPASAREQGYALLQVLATRSTYLILLSENHKVLPTLLGFMAQSPWMRSLLLHYPGLLSLVMHNNTWPAPMDKPALIKHIAERTAGVDPLDAETRMDILRQCKHGQGVLIAAAELTGSLSLMKVSDALTHLAEVIIEEVAQRAWDYLVSKKLIAADIKPLTGFVIVAYGKLAGLELSYSSDLDIIFLYDATDSQLDHKTYVRLGQRILHALQTQTYFGALYEADLRLRPSGQSGLLVSSMTAFAKYQQHSAWTWEHQALVRSRPIVGDPHLFDQFQQVRKATLCQPRDAQKLAQDVADMRAKIQHDIPIQNDSDRIKYGEGGLIDIEFYVQQTALQYAHQYPRIVHWPDDVRLLEAFMQAGIIASETQQRYTEAYLRARAAEHRLVLTGKAMSDR